MNTRSITLVLAGLATLGPFSIDTYFPSFPAIAERFDVGLIQVQQTLSFYLMALAIMALFHGALSDSFGRRRVILVSLAIYSLTAFSCALAPHFAFLLFFRTVQGLAAGAGMIVGQAIIRDCFEGVQAHKQMAQVTMLYGLSPAIAPVIGGYLHTWFGWQGPFVFLGLFGLLLLLACHVVLPETLPIAQRRPFHPVHLSRNYWQVLRHREFMALAFSLSLGSGGFLLYVASAPDVVLTILRLTETQFAWLFVPIVFGLVTGSWLANRLAGIMPTHWLVTYSYGLMGIAVIFNLLYHVFFPARIPWTVLPLVFYTMGFALQAPILTIRSLDFFPEKRGLASSLRGFTAILFFALLSAFITPLVLASGIKHAVAMAVMLILNWLGWLYHSSRHNGNKIM